MNCSLSRSLACSIWRFGYVWSTGCSVPYCCRTDLDNFEIPATGRYVAKVSYATSLMRQGVLIQTTEHLLSALIGMGVDNVIAELDNLELPSWMAAPCLTSRPS